MRHRRSAIYGASAVVLLAVVVFTLRISVGDIPITSAKATGETLSVIKLAPAERIVVDYVGSACRAFHKWNFVLHGGSNRQLVVIEEEGSYDSGAFHADRPSPIGAITLAARDCKGIDDLLRVYRHPAGTSGSTTTIKIRVSYFRNDEMIGVEEFVDEGMIEYWIWHRDEDGTVPASSGVTPEMLSFPMLFRRTAESNHSTADNSGASPLRV